VTWLCSVLNPFYKHFQQKVLLTENMKFENKNSYNVGTVITVHQLVPLNSTRYYTLVFLSFNTHFTIFLTAYLVRNCINFFCGNRRCMCLPNQYGMTLEAVIIMVISHIQKSTTTSTFMATMQVTALPLAHSD